MAKPSVTNWVFSHDSLPSVSDYISAIDALGEKLSGERLETLQFQFSCPGRGVTMTELQEHFGDHTEGSRQGNFIYARAAKLFADEMKFDTGFGSNGKRARWPAISTWDRTISSWVMRTALAEALISQGLVDPENDGILLPDDLPDADESTSTTEGRRILVAHVRRERDPRLVQRKKDSVDSLACEVCEFDAEDFYGVEYCEVHHKKALGESDTEQQITLKDLAIVCANCHRQLHRQYPALTVKELKRQIRT